jgi:PAS domain S-box-containing protein
MPGSFELAADASPEELRLRVRQQGVNAEFGRFVLVEDDLKAILDEACRVAAEGLGVRLAKVLQWCPGEGDFLVRAGVGWRPGVVGQARLGADDASPAGHAFRTGAPVVANHLGQETRFRMPDLLVEHGVLRAINVLIGEGEGRFGVLEADATDRGSFDRCDTAFLQGLANTLAAAIERQRRQARLRASEALIHGVLEASPDCIKVVDGEGRILLMNQPGLGLMELDGLASVVGQPWAGLWPEEEAPKVHDAVAAALCGRPARFEAFCPTAKGTPKWWDVIVTLLASYAGTAARLVGVSRDITERVAAARAKDRLLQEKDLLLQEVHHRVKNSLQLVQSLLNFQARAAEDAVLAERLAESALRVRTIAAIHDRLYRNGTALQVEVDVYLGALIEELRQGMASTSSGRQIHLVADAAVWPASQVPTLGLVVTELVTNALKYGSGEIGVMFRQESGGAAELVVEDEGPGLPESFEPGQSQGLGMRLVAGLLQGGGSIAVDRSCGHTRFVARLPRLR